MAADHLLSAEAVLADGSLATFEAVSLEEAYRRAGWSQVPVELPPNPGANLRPHALNSARTAAQASKSLESAFYRAALEIREHYAAAIRERWPRAWRRASGYNLNYLLPWSPSEPPRWPEASQQWSVSGDLDSSLPYPPVTAGEINLAPLLAGSEGTLAVIRRATLRLVPRPRHTILGVLPYPNLAAACEAVPALLEYQPAAIELIPESLIRLARSIPAYARLLTFLDRLCGEEIPAAMLVVEFAGSDPARLRAQAARLGPGVELAETEAEQKEVWAVRKVGLGILMSRTGDYRPVPFIEDLSVPVDRLGEFVSELERIFAAHGTSGDIYAHASAGCLHIRPLLDLKSRTGVASLRSIAVEAVSLVIRLGGAASGEHGDGLARSEWLERTFGGEVMAAFRLLKEAADPRGLLNPGKILDAQPMDVNLRFGPEYQAQGWSPVMDFSRQAGLLGAVELCNGAGVCRKSDGVMCPSFQATGEEMHSTRGRANLLRAMFSGRLAGSHHPEEAVREALDLCLACKGCKAECPSAVDMAKLKYEFLAHYYRASSAHRRPPRDYVFAHIELLGRIGYAFAPWVNAVFAHPAFTHLSERLFGVSHARRYPALCRQPLRRQAKGREDRRSPLAAPVSGLAPTVAEDVLFLSDPFTEYFYPEVEAGLAALQALHLAGCRVHLLPIIGAGRTLLSKGFLSSARRYAARVVAQIDRIDPQGKMPVVGVEPSEIYTMRDEYLDLLPGDERVRLVAERAYLIDEFLVRRDEGGMRRVLRIVNPGKKEDQTRTSKKVLLHGHCYQKAQPPAADGDPLGVAATVMMLEAAGYSVSVIDSGCCGMAGAFGYEVEHYAVSQQVAELALFPAIRKAGQEQVIAAAGISCQAQIRDGTGREAIHPIRLIVP
jgi:Fe-S oxidoreductase/FAD/FMN-containing dehydrogenase